MLTQQRIYRRRHAGVGDKCHLDLGSAFELFESEVKLAAWTDARQ
jgi:hypothetical protein